MRTRAIYTGPSIAGIPDLLASYESVVQAQPNDPAATCGSQVLTFTQLDELSETLADDLRPHLAGPARPVAVLMDRGTRVAAAVVACLKLGRPFLLLPLAATRERYAMLIDIARPCAIVADEPGLDQYDNLPIVSCTGGQRLAEPKTRSTPEQSGSAYMMFTSGTTGRPKCVEVGRAALSNRIAWAQRYFRLTQRDTILQKTVCTFDVAVWEIVWPLTVGARVEFLPQNGHLDPGAVAQAIIRSNTTICHFVPSMLSEFLKWPEARLCQSLTDILCSGETLHPSLVRKVGVTLPGVRLHNLYGPTEAAIDVTHWQVPAPLNDCERVLIGLPIDNVEVQVVDQTLAPVSLGEVGELLIVGSQLADGYVGEPDLTSAAFVTVSNETRAYRTGDIVRSTADGLEYVGRSDRQVKVHGERVEPAAVEDVLLTHHQIGDAIVVTTGDHGDVTLVALVVPLTAQTGVANDSAELPAALRSFVRSRLSPANVPTCIVVLDAMPTTDHGKRDAARIADIARSAMEFDSGDAPADILEETWRRVLPGAPNPALGFVDIGGDSLRAMRLSSELVERCGFRVPLRWLLVENVSLGELRERMVAAPRTAEIDYTGPGLAPARARELWIHEKLHGSLDVYNVAAAIVVEGRPDRHVFEHRLDDVLRRHDVLRSRYGDDEPSILVESAVARPLSVRVAHPETTFAEQVQELVDDLQRGCYPSSVAPLFHVALLLDSTIDQSAIVIAGSHLILDQTSLELIWQELLTGPHDRGIGSSVAVQQSLAAEELARADDVSRLWRAQLARSSSRPEIASARPRPVRRTFRPATARRRVPAVEVAEMTELATVLGVRRTSLFLTSFAAVMASWTGRSGCTIGVPFDSRREFAEASMVGFFADALPVYCDLEMSLPLAANCRRVQRTVDTCADWGHPPHTSLPTEATSSRRMVLRRHYDWWFNDLSMFDEGLSRTSADRYLLWPKNPAALFDVGLYFEPDGRGNLGLRASCDADVLDVSDAELICESVLHVLRQAVATRGQTILGDLLPTGSVPEAGIVVSSETVEGLFERVAEHGRSSPQRTAIETRASRTTYAELVHATKEIASVLRSAVRGSPGSPVALLARRRPGLAAAVLAGWSASVPLEILDAQISPEYLRTAISRAGANATFIVAAGDGLCIDLLPGFVADVDPRSRDRDRSHSLDAATSHILLTSGTSGEPSLVAVNGRAFATALVQQCEQFGLGEHDRFAVLSGVGHDPIFRDLISPLALGATAVVPPDEIVGRPEALVAWLRDGRISVMSVTPSRAALLVAVDGRTPISEMRVVLVGGEALDRELARDLMDLFPNAALFNCFGTTEVPQVGSSYAVTQKDVTRELHGGMPIGNGTAQRQLAVTIGDRVASMKQVGEIAMILREPRSSPLAEDLRLADVEGVGEVVLTGDLGWTDARGNVVWFGRVDRQLSVGGYRVSPQEVERCLLQDGEVSRALVSQAVEPSNSDGFVAYVCRRTEVPDDPNWCFEVRERLRKRLPPWAIPGVIHSVPYIATGLNGKPDVAATAALIRRRPRPSRGSFRETVALLKTVLERHVRVEHDTPDEVNFFELGLDSLGMFRLLADLRSVGYTELSLVDLFRLPSLRALATQLDSRRPSQERLVAAGAPGAEPAERRRRLRHSLRETHQMEPRRNDEDDPIG